MDVVGVIKEKVAKSLAKQWSDFEYSSLEVNVPPKPEFGDYTCPIALPLAKILDENPVEIAEKIAAEIKADGVILNISVSAPGFVNFFINYPVLAEEVLQSKWDLKTSTKKKVSIEHTSVNPNKAAHIGHLRNACLGDTLANLLRTQGHEVEVQNYIDDLGLQVADSVLAFEEYRDTPDERPVDEWFWEIYAKISQRLTRR
ncbi:MAG: arginine--tRNA ligase [Patescibacteria group bacterium]